MAWRRCRAQYVLVFLFVMRCKAMCIACRPQPGTRLGVGGVADGLAALQGAPLTVPHAVLLQHRRHDQAEQHEVGGQVVPRKEHRHDGRRLHDAMTATASSLCLCGEGADDQRCRL